MAEIHPICAEEARQLLAWADEEGWNPGLNDADCFWNVDPDGFLGLSESGKLIGGGAIIRHSDQFGFMGLFIVAKPYRGQGMGKRLWLARRDRLLDRLSHGGVIGLDGVDAMVPFYEQGGFVPFTRHRRFELTAPLSKQIQNDCVVDISSVELPALAEYDRHCFPARRERFLAEWISQPGAVSLAFVKGGSLLGYGVMRPCLVGWKIGPLFADSFEIADALFQSFQLASEERQIFLDVPDNNPTAIALCQKHNMQEVFGCVRMYYGSPPSLSHERIFGITTLEIG